MNSTITKDLFSVRVNLFPNNQIEFEQGDDHGNMLRILINTKELKEIYDFVKKELLKRK